MDRIRVLIVEDNPLIAEDIAECLDSIDFEVLGIAYDKETAFDALANHHPDAVLLDINLDGKMDGIEIGKKIHEKYQLPFIYLTSYADRKTLSLIKPTRPYGYIVKPFDEKDLLSALEIAIYNHAQRHIPRKLSMDNINAKIFSNLTQKEYDVLMEIYEGKTNRAISEQHHVSLNTVKTHIKKIYEKLGVNNRSRALVFLRSILE